MKRGFLIFLTLCSLTAAMVPRPRREAPRICAPNTPCAWTIYRPNTKIVDTYIENSNYCICSVGTVCEITEGDGNAFVHKCRQQSEIESTTES